jgi:hypothetical protein
LEKLLIFFFCGIKGGKQENFPSLISPVPYAKNLFGKKKHIQLNITENSFANMFVLISESVDYICSH